MAHTARLEFSYPDSRRAEIVERSVGREVGEIGGDRTAASLEREGARVTVAIEAADLVALRAGLNTWLTLVDVAEDAAAVGR